MAASFVSELTEMDTPKMDLELLLSSQVSSNLGAPNTPTLIKRKIHNVKGFKIHDKKFQSLLNRFHTVFTVFGPLYVFHKQFRSVVGFAQPWIIYPDNECYGMLPLFQRLKTRLKFRIQSWFFRRADTLVVELEHVKQGLIRELGIPAERIHVVHNCLSSIYHREDLWQDVNVPDVECDLRLGFLGRNYLHKNTAIFPQVSAVLEKKYGIRAKFFVTFTDEEWQACSPDFRAACINLGPLTVAQCPNFYRAMDAIVFPSLLECFSATPLETMAMECPLIASDRPFNRDVCGHHAHYFDPLDPESAAAQIAGVFKGGGLDPEALRAARDHAISFSNPRERAEKYLALVTCAR